MQCVDTSFCIDLAKGDPPAIAVAEQLDSLQERIAIPAPALTEFLVGAFARGGKRLEAALRITSRMEVLPVSEAIALEAARIGGRAIQDGTPVGTLDLLVAATAKVHGLQILTRDTEFGSIPGLSIRTY